MSAHRPSFALAALVVTAFACAACPTSAPDEIDAGVGAIVDGGAPASAAFVDAGAIGGAPEVPLAPDPLSFRFVRLRAPTPLGEEILRISLDERARIVDGAPELRSAPSPAALAKLVAACAKPAVRDLLRKAGDTAPAMTLIELGCAPVGGVIACDPAARCDGAFDELRDDIVTAWREEQQEPDAGLTLRTAGWTNGWPTPAANINVVMSVNGKPLLPAKGDPFARAPAGKRVTLCTDNPNLRATCTDVVPPSLVHLDVVGNTTRFRCATCVAVAPPRVPGAIEKQRTERLMLAVVKAAIPGIEKRCGQRVGPRAIRVRWVIEASGAASSVTLAGRTSSPREKCVAAEVGRMRFAAMPQPIPASYVFAIGR